MPALNPQTLLSESSCLICQGMTIADALMLALLGDISDESGGGGVIPSLGLQGWWKGDSLGADGTDINSWDDSSGNGNTLLPWTTPGFFVPAVVVTTDTPFTPGPRKWAYFDAGGIGDDGTLESASNIFGTTNEFTLFAVYVAKASGTWGIAGQHDGISNNKVFVITSENTSPSEGDPGLDMGSFGVILDTTGQSVDFGRIAGVRFDGSLVKVYDTYTQLSSEVHAILTDTTKFRIGSRSPATDILNGYVAEVIAYNRELTMAEYNSVVLYLREKYFDGVTSDLVGIPSDSDITVDGI